MPSAQASALASGLGGAIGSDYRPAQHHLLFVEFDGKVSRDRPRREREVARYDLAASVFTPTGPMLLGIGHVPADRISRSSPIDPVSDGYADTTVDPGYFFQVKDAPFGGTLPIMFNHERAYAEGARYYKLLLDADEPRQSWTDYRWSTSANRFLAQVINPTASGYYRVRSPSELWYNHWLGYMLSSAAVPNGIHTIGIRVYTSQSSASEMGSMADPGRTIVVMIDNAAPLADIEQIIHDGSMVGTCGIVDSGSDAFTFRITASDAEQHMLNWSLAALWGDNRSTTVDGDSYAAHTSPSRKWAGVNSGVVPMVAASPWHATPGDPTSTRCAHTFRLSAWSRVIDGYNRLHRAEYHKSVTIMLP